MSTKERLLKEPNHLFFALFQFLRFSIYKESEEKIVKTDDDFIKSVIDENKVDIQISKEIKKYNEKILQTANRMIKYHLGFLISIKRGLTL